MKLSFYSFLASSSLYLAVVVCLLTGGCVSPGNADFTAIEKGFVNPPDSMKIGVYWYWISDNISKEGIVKDLHAMKAAGINRAYIGNIGVASPKDFGKVKIFTDEWWDAIHTAMKTATELDIEIGMFNSPGWSQSGGPWVKPGQAMRYLASTELRVKGPVKLSQQLTKPVPDFQDVKVLAWPVPKDYKKNLFRGEGAQVYVSHASIENKMNSKAPAKYILPETPESYIGVELSQPTVVRSLVIYPAGNFYAKCELQVKDGSGYRTIKAFEANRTNAALNVGFDPYAPVAISFSGIQASDFRIVFHEAHAGSSIKEILLSASPVIERYAEKSLAKMFQTPLPYWNEYLWPSQAEVKDVSLLIDVVKVVDISGYMSENGILTWDVPEGEWIIMRTGMTPTGVTNSPAPPEGTGLEVDKMSKQHVASHFDAYLGEMLRRIPAADRKSWKVVVQDSYEMGSQNFTDGFLEEFRQRYGYDPAPFLPVYQGYTIGSPDQSDRFLWDMRRLVADKVSYDYVGGLREVSNKHGLTTWLENYGHWGFPGEFLQYGGQSDEVGGEFWSEGELGNIENRAASSCAHIYGKTRVWAESFTCGGPVFSRYPGNMKKRGDWSFTEGINNTLLHVYIHQPYDDRVPGVNAWFGNEFNRLNTWYSQLDMFVTYLKRSNFMLQQGLNVADVAYFIGEDAPKMTGVRDPELPKGYSFDYINGEVILRDLSVKDGRLVLPHGTSYRVLVLPKLETMRPEVLQKLEQLVSDGAVILGPPPNRSPSMQGYPGADKQVQMLVKKMWGDEGQQVNGSRVYGKGMVLTGMDMQQALDIIKVVPDCSFAANDPALYVHRVSGGNHIYFITNQGDKRIQINPQFRVSGMQPELWDAVSGAVRELPAFSQQGEVTSVPLQLDPSESAFIVFRKKGKPAAKSTEANYPTTTLLAELTSPWSVKFESDAVKRGPTETITLNQLQDWTKHPDERVRYYSGTAVYQTTFPITEMPPGKLFLDLGEVNVMAKVKVNGQYVGGVWTAPYRVDISKSIKNGANSLEVEVVNNWVNRLIGDCRLPKKKRATDLFANDWNADSPLQASGLVGPVKLLIEN